MDTTGKQLLDHWNWAAEKGLMNRNSATNLRTACQNVLPVLDNWEEIDVASIDVDDTIRRFQTLHARKFSPVSLAAYAKRFKAAVASFLEYSANPSAWKPTVRPPKPPSQKVAAKKDDAFLSESEQQSEYIAPTRSGLIDYPFPIRENVVARLMLPRDLTTAEAKRITGFMMALVVDPAS